MKNNLYIIHTLTNMHVGSGDASFGLVDNLIQRDCISNLPNINSSSLKGAFREFFGKCHDKDFDVTEIFGNEVRNASVPKAGSCKFFDAYLLALPVRSNLEPYMMVTCPMVLNNFIKTAQLFGVECSLLQQIAKCSLLQQIAENLCNDKCSIFNYENSKSEKVSLEDITVDLSSYNLDHQQKEMVKTVFGDAPLVVVPDDKFTILCADDHLPIISRNYIENGISRNLFFEQVLPRESVLYFMLLTPETLKGNFVQKLSSEVFQIGAGATIGEGYCTLKLFNEIKSQDDDNK